MKNIIIGNCAYCHVQVERRNASPYFACRTCQNAMGRDVLTKFNRVMKRLDFMYGREEVDAHVEKVLNLPVHKLSLLELARVM